MSRATGFVARMVYFVGLFAFAGDGPYGISLFDICIPSAPAVSMWSMSSELLHTYRARLLSLMLGLQERK